MKTKINNWAHRYLGELITLIFGVVITIFILVMVIYSRQTKVLNGVETTVRNDSIQINNQEIMKRNTAKAQELIKLMKK